MDIEDPWKSADSGSSPAGLGGFGILQRGNDDQLMKIKESLKKGLNDTTWGPVYKLFEDENSSAMEFEAATEKIDVNDKHLTGVPLLTYCVAFDRLSFLESLLMTKDNRKKKMDLNVKDDFNKWTPIMWCCYLDRYSCLTELMRFSDELDLYYKTATGQSLESLAVPGTAIYGFMDIHQVFTKKPQQVEDLYKAPADINPGIDSTMDELNLQTAGLRVHDDIDEDTAYFHPAERSTAVEQPPDIPPESEFNYKILEPRQYIVFTSLDIDKIAALVETIPNKFPHKPNIAAAVTFQCIRYAHHKRNNRKMIESVYDLCLQKLCPPEEDQDILKKSYALGYLNFLYYYLYRDETVLPAYPNILQNIIDTMLSLIKSLSSAINNRLKPLLVSGILEYTTISDVKETLYKNDWNFFKKRKINRLKHDSYDHILKQLYPPSVKEQMKPSPLKIVQIFGALTYVFDLHSIHPVLLQQCISISAKWLAHTIFNELIRSKQLLSRAHAMQIRLNLSILHDWVKNHNFKVDKPELMDTFMWQRFPLTIVQDVGAIDLSDPSKQPIKNVLFYKPVAEEPCSDETNSLFFYQPFARIWQYHFEPVYQLLQWLQVATSLEASEDVMQSTLKLFNRLNATQLYKSLDRYRYEINEEKSKMKKLLRQRVKAEKEEEPIMLETEFDVYLALPTLHELYALYDECESSYIYLPVLPVEIQDEVDDVHDQVKGDQDLETASGTFENMDEPKPAAHAVWSSNDMKLQENPW